MNVCIIGEGLTSIALAKNLINKKINVHIYYKTKIQKKITSRTIGISKNNLEFFKKEIFVLEHENLLDNQEKVSREIIDYCDLDWENECLEFYKTEGQVQTASNEQVREPINKKSVAAWKKYEEFLQPLIKALN